jgi:GUN4-like/Caspase domain
MANNWAIVAGINDYDFLPGAPLKFAVADALAMRSFLCDEVGFKLDQVLFCGDGTAGNKRATKSVLRDILLHQIQRAKNADNLWFFFSGHGIAEHLMPIDGNPRDLKETAISIHFVTDCLRNCNAKNIVLVLDMCRSEGRDPGERTVDSIEASLREFVKQREGQQGIIMLFSCGSGERSYEVKELGQGAFTYALLEGLRKTTIVKDLERHLAERVPELHRIYPSDKRRKQVPLVIPEPGWKYHEPILSSHATEADIARLKEMAIDAECDGDFPVALRLWEQINLLATKPDDRSRALNKTTDLVRRSQSQQPASPTPTTERPQSASPIPTTERPQPLTQQPLDAIPLESENGVDYRKLRDLLKASQWRKADRETLHVMLQVSNRESVGWLNSDDLKNFPCKDLKTIDRLWVTASNDHFGFSVQMQIWQECGSSTGFDKNWDRFCVRVGWQSKNRTTANYVDYVCLGFDPSISSRGELPIIPSVETFGARLFSRAKTCKI